MQANTNTDMVGGLAVLAVSAFFYSQISEDFTQFGVFFPKLILPCLVLLGVILLVRGLARRTKKKTIFRINRTMALVMIVGALWAVTMNYLGFIVGSSLALSIIVLAYLPAGKRTPARIFANLSGVLGVVLAFYYGFTRLLDVLLPVGHLMETLMVG